jgi:hypothetical protein
MNSLPLECVNDIMYMYTVGLTAGETIQDKAIKTATIKGYLAAASEYILTIGERQSCPMADPRTGKEHSKITRELKEFERWEKIPNRKDPLTKKMLNTLAKDMAPRTHIDSKENAFIDWCTVGLHMGYRRCEWASDKAAVKPEDVTRCENPTKDIYQAVLDDYRLLGEQGKRLTTEEELTYSADKLSGAVITVRFQKNGHHGEKVSQAANTTQPDFCCARAIQRIKQRAKRLGLQGHHPASAYRAFKKSVRPSFFHASMITKLLRKMAEITYDCDLKEAGLNYTGHSLRIGATVILYCGGARDTDIQHRLRWRSMTFLTYLRDVPQAAINHMHLVNAITADVESWG